MPKKRPAIAPPDESESPTIIQTIEMLSEEHNITPTMILGGLLEALSRRHVFRGEVAGGVVNPADVHGDIRAVCRLSDPPRDPERDPPASLLEAMRLALDLEWRQNAERAEAPAQPECPAEAAVWRRIWANMSLSQFIAQAVLLRVLDSSEEWREALQEQVNRLEHN